jgi:hypothetical protein
VAQKRCKGSQYLSDRIKALMIQMSNTRQTFPQEEGALFKKHG